MSRIENKTFNGIPYQYDTSLSSSAGASYTDKGLNDTTNTSSSNAARFAFSTMHSYTYFYKFNTTEIPQVAHIQNVSYKVRVTAPNKCTFLISLSNLTNNVGNSISVTKQSVYLTEETNGGIWDVSDLVNLRLKLTHGNSFSNTCYFFGADLTISYDLYYYSISTTSNVQGVSISSTSNETLEGGSNTITLSNVSDISTIKVMDNDNDITSLFTRSGSNYTYTLSNINADHTIVVEDNSSSSSNKSYVKKNGSFVESTGLYKKESSTWTEKSLTSIYWKIGGNWTETNDSMSGKTMFKVE